MKLKRIEDFENLGLGLFIHWGLYSQLAKGEWAFDYGSTSMEEYKKLADTFTAEDFDSEKLVLFAKNNGFKYIVLTTKHHEGFCLYDTKGLNDFDAPHSAAKRDLIKEFADSCHKHDIKPFFYHATLDWFDPNFDKDFNTYLKYLRDSVEVLCKNYGEVGGFWFDGNWSKLDADWQEDELYGVIRKYQPNAIIVNNTGLEARGEKGNPEIDSVTFEQGKPDYIERDGEIKYVASEVCMTLNDHWGAADCDFNYKSPKDILENLCDSRKYGANFLLNIGPEGQGKISDMQKAYIEIIGRWMSIFGEAIYKGKPYTATEFNGNYILKGDDCLYIVVKNLVIDGSENVVANTAENCVGGVFGGVVDTVKSIRWMDNDEELKFSQKGEKLEVHFSKIGYGANYCVRIAKAEL